MRVLIAGAGYVGIPLGAELARQGHEVFGLRRSLSGDEEMQAANVSPLHADVTSEAALSAWPNHYDWVVNSVATGGGNADEYRQLYLQGAANLIKWLSPASLKKFIHVSSTAVYSQTDGSQITESSATNPTTDTAQILLETEQALLAAVSRNNFPAVILRAAGIYGPSRGYLLKQYLRGEARIEGEGGRFLNMIHRDDLIGVIIAALESGKPGTVYNVVDDEPVSQLDFFTWLSAKLGKPPPPAAPFVPSAARKRGLTSKRVSNALAQKTLGYKFKYPTFREGYAVEIERLTSGI